MPFKYLTSLFLLLFSTCIFANETTSTEPYIKLDQNGKALPQSAKSWQCAQSKKSGLIWEVKTTRNQYHTSQWKSALQDVPKKLNHQKLCGYNDWRLPNRAELASLLTCINYPKCKPVQAPHIDKLYFPNTQNWYWTATPFGGDNGFAWNVYFDTGSIDGDSISRSNHTRLVRGNQKLGSM